MRKKTVTKMKKIEIKTHLGWVFFVWGIGGCVFGIHKAIFMHDPISPRPMWGLSSIKNQSFLHPHNLVTLRSYNLLVNPGGLPVTGTCGSVGSVPIRILGFPSAEEVPLLLRITWTPESSCIRKIVKNRMLKYHHFSKAPISFGSWESLLC